MTLNHLMVVFYKLKLWEMLCTSPLTLLPGSLRPGVVALDRVLSLAQIKLFALNLCTFNNLSANKRLMLS